MEELGQDDDMNDHDQMTEEENLESQIDPEFRETQMSFDQKLALQNGIKTWDSKFKKIMDMKTKEMEDKIPQKKK
jgi:hypothetical protein